MSINQEINLLKGIEDVHCRRTPMLEEVKNEKRCLIDGFAESSIASFGFGEFNRFSDFSEIKLVKQPVKALDSPRSLVAKEYTLTDLVVDEKYGLQRKHLDQLNEWTGRQCGDVVFDSTVSTWSKESSEFNKMIVGKRQLAIVIETTDGEKFGYYINPRIVRNYMKRKAVDTESFAFSLESKHRQNVPLKYEINDIYAGGYMMKRENEETLITLGDIVVMKKERAHRSYCCSDKKNVFQYDIKYPLSHKREFTPSRILVIQMM